VIARFQRGDARSDFDDNAGTFMTKDRRKQPLRIRPGQRELVGVADARGLDFHKHLKGTRAFQIDRGYLKRFSCGNCNCCTSFHT